VAHGSVRFSISRLTTAEEVDEAARMVPECIARLRRSA
jgi:cysteine sulfinate desulfinase/cysteine desulfurase-like protein